MTAASDIGGRLQAGKVAAKFGDKHVVPVIDERSRIGAGGGGEIGRFGIACYINIVGRIKHSGIGPIARCSPDERGSEQGIDDEGVAAVVLGNPKAVGIAFDIVGGHY